MPCICAQRHARQIPLAVDVAAGVPLGFDLILWQTMCALGHINRIIGIARHTEHRSGP